MWPVSFAITKVTTQMQEQVAGLVERARELRPQTLASPGRLTS